MAVLTRLYTARFSVGIFLYRLMMLVIKLPSRRAVNYLHNVNTYNIDSFRLMVARRPPQLVFQANRRDCVDANQTRFEAVLLVVLYHITQCSIRVIRMGS